MAGSYSLGIVGESNYQSEIRRCRRGQGVEIIHEADNPYDELALAVVTTDGATIGYVPRGSWLRDAVHDEGKGCDAKIKSINTAGDGLLGVVLQVSLNLDGVRARRFHRPRRQQSAPPKNWLARFLGLS